MGRLEAVGNRHAMIEEREADPCCGPLREDVYSADKTLRARASNHLQGNTLDTFSW